MPTYKRFGLHYFSHNNTDWTVWYASQKERDQKYHEAKEKVSHTKSAKHPYRYVKKVTK